MRRRPDDRPTGLPRAYSRQAVLIAAFHDVVVATRCRTRLLDLALPVTHLTSGRAVHERLPQLRPVRDKWVEHAMPSVAIVLAAMCACRTPQHVVRRKSADPVSRATPESAQPRYPSG